MRRLALLFTALVAFVLSCTTPAFAAGGPQTPSGYRIEGRRSLAPGVTFIRMRRARPPLAVSVAWIERSANVELKTVLSNEAIFGPSPRFETTSAMCLRVRCLAAINGDFFAETGEPVGAVVNDAVLARSPNAKHHQLIIAPDGSLSTGVLEWRGSLVPEDLRPVELDGVNLERRADKVVLYTSHVGPSTGTNPHGVELIVQPISPAGPLRLGQTSTVRLVDLRHGGDTPIPVGGAVLSGHGRGAVALQSLWSRVQQGRTSGEALLRLETTPDAMESMGGSPILVRDGKRWFARQDRSLYTDRHPRSIVGWDEAGDIMLVTVDGRQPGFSVGMTMDEAADLMIGLGATEALNLDGGGSTTFVVGGAVANQVSDRSVRRSGKVETVAVPRSTDFVLGRVERPVAVALAVVPPPGITFAGPLEATLPRWGETGAAAAAHGRSSRGHAAVPITVLSAVAAQIVRAPCWPRA